ncbi:nucleotide exchange factor GrpE [Patescibacteria group bacterium]|nr:nucleotide exchange factor GrpE [Patescibacteria group bacterium]MBU3922643.1 nucleotide exchange factor GrpE [Patescibacteria group bacterium]
MSELKYVSEQEDKNKKAKNKLKICQKERSEYLAGWQRAKADLINFRKEQESRNSDIFKFANQNFVLEILPVLDSFELALKHKNEGIEQLYLQFKNILKSNGLEEIKSIGEKFNPEFHESIGEIKGKKGFVIQEIQKGYVLNNKVIRPSRIKIGKN